MQETSFTVSLSLDHHGDIRDSLKGPCLMQAIALIVTHRTDDMSKLPPVTTTEVLKKPNQAAGMPELSAHLPCAHNVVGIA